MRLHLLMLFLFPIAGFASPIALDFRDVSVVEFAQSTYKSILGRDLIVSPDVIGVDSKVTISIKAIDKTKLPKLLSEVLASAGVVARDADGVVHLEKTPPVRVDALENAGAVPGQSTGSKSGSLAVGDDAPDAEKAKVGYDVYRPQFRTVEYLQTALRSAGLGGAALGQGQQSTLDTLIVAGSDERRAKMLELLEALDHRPNVLNVRAALVEFTDSTSDSFSLGGVLSALTGRLSITANSSNSTTNFARLKTGSLDVVLGAMNGDSRFRFRTQPFLRLVDGEMGRFQVGSDVPIRGPMTITQSGQQVQSTEYKASGLVLSVLPRVLKDRIYAKVTQEVSSFSQTTTSGIDSPTLNKRLIEAVVDAEDGEVVVLGGLDETSTSEGKTGLSWLPFALSKSHSDRTTQLLVLLEFQRL